jgi:lipase
VILHAHVWGRPGPETVVCIHGIGQNGSVFAELGERLAGRGHAVVALDLRGHGASGWEPPWDTETHASDVLETLDSRGIGAVTWVGHSFGARTAAAIAARAKDRTRGLVLLEPGLQVAPDRALRRAEVERLDWTFATRDGAVNALMAAETTVATPRSLLESYVERNTTVGPDGRFRFNFCPSAVVTAWSEMARGAPEITPVRTLMVAAEASFSVSEERQQRRYQDVLGDRLTTLKVPNGHNVLWEAPAETIAAVEAFVGEPRTDEAPQST